jgi:hypothetical protein
MPPDDLGVFVMFGHIANELSMLSRIAIFAINYPADHSARHSFHTAQAMMMMKVLGGKAHAGWEFVGKAFFSTAVGKKHGGGLPPEAEEAKQNLGKYFGKKNIIAELRNQFAFHYLTTGDWVSQIAASVAAIPDETAQIFNGGMRVNSLWQYPEMVVNHALFQTTKESDLAQAMDKVIDEVVTVSGWVSTFCENTMWAIAHKSLGDGLGLVKREQQTFSDVPKLHEVVLPALVDPGDIEKIGPRRQN